MFKLKIRFYLIIFSGVLSAIIGILFSYLTKLIYKPAIIMPEVFVSIFINPSDVNTIRGIVLGNLGSLFISIIHVFFLVFLLDFTGWQNSWFKSLIVTSTGYLFAVSLMYFVLGNFKDPLALMFFYSTHLVYLTASALIVNKLGTPLEHLK